MLRRLPVIITILIGAFVGALLSYLEHDLFLDSYVPGTTLIHILFGVIVSVSIYFSYSLSVKKRAIETDLEYNDIFLHTIMESAPIGICLVRERKFVYANEFFCHMLGYRLDEIVGKSTRMIYPDEIEYKFVGEQYGEVEKYGTGIIETRILCKNGLIKHVHFTSAPLDQNDREKGLVFTALDITVRKNMEVELKNSYAELERRKDAYKEAHRLEQLASIEKTNFQTNMSHEIRTPLNGILGMLQLLQSNLLNEENISTVNYAIESCRRLADLLNDIIDFTKIERGKEALLNNPFDLRDVMDMLNALFKPAAEQKGLSFEINFSENIPQILIGDNKKLQQILNSLVGNAVKFTSTGYISIEVSPVSLSHNTCRLFFTVSDTGIGIPEAEINDIFSAYSQVDGSYTRHYEGVGLGLAIVKKLIEIQDGNIEVKSEVGKGTSFSFSLEYRVPDPGIDY